MRKIYQKVLEQFKGAELAMVILLLMGTVMYSSVIVAYLNATGSILILIPAIVCAGLITAIISVQPPKMILDISLIGIVANILAILLFII